MFKIILNKNEDLPEITYQENGFLYINELKKVLKILDNNFDIICFQKGHGNCCQVSYKKEHICSVPKGKIYWNKYLDYTDASGIPHRSIKGLISLLKNILPDYKIKKFIQFKRSKNYLCLK